MNGSKFLADTTEPIYNKSVDDAYDYIMHKVNKTTSLGDEEYSSEDNDYSTQESSEDDSNEEEVTSIEDDNSIYDVDHILESSPLRRKSHIWWIVIILGVIFGFTIRFILTMNNNADLSFASTPTVKLLENQITKLYSELHNMDNANKKKLDSSIEESINLFEQSIKKLIPKDLLKLKSQLDLINQRIELLSDKVNKIQNSAPSLTYFSDNNQKIIANPQDILRKLKDSLPSEIPIIIDGQENNMMILPEIYDLISKSFDDIESKELQNIEDMKIDIDNYIEELITEKYQLIDRQTFLDELEKYFTKNNEQVQHNIKASISKIKIPSSIVYQYEQNDVDFATIVQGTKLIQSLTSQTYPQGNGVSPIELLMDTKSIASSTYWQCSMNKHTGCSWGIQFIKPLFLTHVSYTHGRMQHNLHLMNTAPKRISIYVRPMQPLENHILEYHHLDHNYIKVASMEYDIENPQATQRIPLQEWFIRKRAAVRSMVIQVETTDGNTRYVSVHQFRVHGVTKEDLEVAATNKFPLRFDSKGIMDLSEVPLLGSDELDN